MELHGDGKVLFLTCLFVILHYVFLLLLLLLFFSFSSSSSSLLLFLKLFDKLNVYSSAAHVSYFQWFLLYRNDLFSLLFLFFSHRRLTKNHYFFIKNFRFLYSSVILPIKTQKQTIDNDINCWT